MASEEGASMEVIPKKLQTHSCDAKVMRGQIEDSFFLFQQSHSPSQLCKQLNQE